MQTADNIYESLAPHILTPHTEISPPHRGAPTWATIQESLALPFLTAAPIKKYCYPRGQGRVGAVANTATREDGVRGRQEGA